MTSAPTNPFFASIEFRELTLRVRDLARVAAFYRDTLGLRVVDEAAGRVSLSAGGKQPGLVVLEQTPDAPARAAGTAGLFHVAFLFPDRASLGRAARRVASAGALLGASDHGVSEALYLDDPEGNGIELYADRPPEAWPPRSASGEVTMFTAPLDFESLLAEGDRSHGNAVPAQTRIGHVHLSVSAISRAESFYSGVLGFPITQRSYPGALFLGRDGYHHHFGTNTWQSRSPAAPGSLGLARFAVVFASAEEVASVIARARRERCIAREDGSTSALVRDFDGIEIELRAR